MRPLLFFTVLIACLAARADVISAPASDGLKLAAEVHQIFQAKCVDCHGADVPHPKGKFGYVLDLKRVAANPDYIVPGSPEDSDLYGLLEDDEMPGEDAKVPPLTVQEKDVVKRWILAGAPAPPPGADESAPEPSRVVAQTGAAGEKSPDRPADPKAVHQEKPEEPFWTHLLHWAGRFHPVTTHFPVALMFVAAFAEGLSMFRRREPWFQMVRFLIVLAAVGAVVAASSGWVNAAFSSYNKSPWQLLWWHRWLGTFTAVWTVVCAGSSGFPTVAPERRYFRVALFLGAGLVGVSGFLGSALIYGLDHYTW